MSREKVIVEKADMKPAPGVDLRDKVGSKVTGILFKKSPNPTYPKRIDYLLNIDETDAPTRLFDKETNSTSDVDVKQGDLVWVTGSQVLGSLMGEIEVGGKVEIVYLGKGDAKKGQKPPFLYDVFKVTD